MARRKRKTRRSSRKNRRSSMKARARKRAKARNSSGKNYINLPSGVGFVKVEEGWNTIDVIPYEVTIDNHPEGIEKGMLWYHKLFSIHRDIGVNNETVVCPQSVNAGKCPICEKFTSLQEQGYEWDDERVKALRPSDREIFNDRVSGKIKILDYSTFLLGDALQDELADEELDDDVGFFGDPDDSCVIKARFKQQSAGSFSFLKVNKIKFKSREDLDDATIDSAVDLDKAIVVEDYETLYEKFYGASMAQEEEEDDLDYGEEEDDLDYDMDEDEVEDEVELDNPCVACEGTGKNSRGRKCRACKGTGESSDTPEKPKKTKKSPKLSCPHEDVDEFGENCNDLDECADCDIWEKCQDAQDKLFEE